MTHSRPLRADSAQTRERILNASEQLFSERGYSGTSLRAIADAAGVNVASASYHFGSKSGLLEATLERCAGPINAERLRRLDELEAAGGAPELPEIVRAFVEPVLMRSGRPNLARLLARLFAEPKPVSVPLLERAFAAVARRYYQALARALPAVAPDALRWRFHFMIGALVHLSLFETPLRFVGPGGAVPEAAAQSGCEALVRFVVAGIVQENGLESHHA